MCQFCDNIWLVFLYAAFISDEKWKFLKRHHVNGMLSFWSSEDILFNLSVVWMEEKMNGSEWRKTEKPFIDVNIFSPFRAGFLTFIFPLTAPSFPPSVCFPLCPCLNSRFLGLITQGVWHVPQIFLSSLLIGFGYIKACGQKTVLPITHSVSNTPAKMAASACFLKP